MKRSVSLYVAGLAALAAAACSPQTYTLSVDMRYPSKSGLDLSRKTMSIVYMDNGKADTTFSNHVASSLARNLEADYFNGNEVIGVYKIPEDSVNLDLMHRLVMDSGDDVIFLLGAPSFGEVAVNENVPVQNAASVDSAFVTYAQIPYNASLWVYDSMDKSDQVKPFRGSSILRTPVYNNGVTAPEFLKEQALKGMDESADKVGMQIFNRFAPTWRTEGYSLYYYDGFGSNDWIEAIYNAYEYRWKRAADLWMKHVSDKGFERSACACYNLAVAFFMMGDLDIATKWLDRADQNATLSLSPALRKRIGERRK